jgi:hypothetical protein
MAAWRETEKKYLAKQRGKGKLKSYRKFVCLSGFLWKFHTELLQSV